MPRPPFRDSLGDKPSEGARLLRIELRRRKLTSRQAGTQIGVSSGLVSRWLFCDGKPGRALAQRLCELYGIDPTAWDAPPKRTIELRAAS